jgi:hypothetical protein
MPACINYNTIIPLLLAQYVRVHCPVEARFVRSPLFMARPAAADPTHVNGMLRAR